MSDSIDPPKVKPDLAALGITSTPAYRPDPPIAREHANIRRGRGRPSQIVKAALDRSPEAEKTSEPGRLRSLGIRRKLLRSQGPPPVQFVDAPPLLADLVCFAVLEANQLRSRVPFTVASSPWPEVRVEPRWAEIVRSWLLALADLPVADPVHLETEAHLQPSGLATFTIRLLAAGLPPHLLPPLRVLSEPGHLTLTNDSLSVEFLIPVVP